MSSLFANGGGSLIMIVAMVGVFYFLLIRPQQKEQKKKKEMMEAMRVGDTVMTTSGFYGVLIDISDDNTVIVEFGSNRNCRIPMSKAAIQAVERPGMPTVVDKSGKDKKDSNSDETVKETTEEANESNQATEGSEEASKDA